MNWLRIKINLWSEKKLIDMVARRNELSPWNIWGKWIEKLLEPWTKEIFKIELNSDCFASRNQESTQEISWFLSYFFKNIISTTLELTRLDSRCGLRPSPKSSDFPSGSQSSTGTLQWVWNYFSEKLGVIYRTDVQANGRTNLSSLRI